MEISPKPPLLLHMSSEQFLYVCNVKTDDHFEGEDCQKIVSEALGIDQKELQVVHATREDIRLAIRWRGILLSGSAASANDSEPWIDHEMEAIREWMRNGTPILGLCFGHQLLGKVHGREIRKTPNAKSLGIKNLQLTPEGSQSPLFRGVPQTFDVISSHAEAVKDIAPPAVLLATSPHTHIEAVQWNPSTFSIQQHPEMPRWIGEKLASGRIPDEQFTILQTTDLSAAQKIVRNFVSIANHS